MTKLPLTLAVMTYNEAANIARCLDSVPFAEERLVIDCGSTDDTIAIAREHGARVVHQDWLGFGPQRRFATEQSRHDWILALDADEFLTSELQTEMEQRLPGIMASDTAVGILRRHTLFMGAPMRWYRPLAGEMKPRLYHRQRAHWGTERVHESLNWNGSAIRFSAFFEHRHNPTLLHKELKNLRYGELKAHDWAQKRRPPRIWACPFVFMGTFVKDYFLRLAFLDGWRGYIIAQTEASYAVFKRMRHFEMHHNPESIEQGAQLLRNHDLDH